MLPCMSAKRIDCANHMHVICALIVIVQATSVDPACELMSCGKSKYTRTSSCCACNLPRVLATLTASLLRMRNSVELDSFTYAILAMDSKQAHRALLSANNHGNTPSFLVLRADALRRKYSTMQDTASARGILTIDSSTLRLRIR